MLSNVSVVSFPHQANLARMLISACFCACANVCVTRSTIGAGRGCNKFVPVLGGNGTKIAPTGDIFDQPPGQMR